MINRRARWMTCMLALMSIMMFMAYPAGLSWASGSSSSDNGNADTNGSPTGISNPGYDPGSVNSPQSTGIDSLGQNQWSCEFDYSHEYQYEWDNGECNTPENDTSNEDNQAPADASTNQPDVAVETNNEPGSPVEHEYSYDYDWDYDFGPKECFYNGERLQFDQDPIMVENRTMVELRGFFEAFGGQLYWDEALQEARGNLNGMTVQIRINTRTALINGQEAEMDVPAMIVNGRTMVPLRFMAESFGKSVRWDDNTASVFISDTDQNNGGVIH